MKNNRNYRPAGRDRTRPEASRRPARPQSRPQEEESVRGMQREDIVIGRNGVIELPYFWSCDLNSLNIYSVSVYFLVTI